MGMTIDKAIKRLQDMKRYYNNDTGAAHLGFDKADNETVDFAIDIMCKYQIVEEERRWKIY